MRSLTLLAVFVIASPALAQTPIKLMLLDGSTIRCETLASSLPVATRYGDLAIPFAEVQSVRFGLHPTDAERKRLAAAIRSLGSSVFHERNAANASLKALGPIAAQELLRLSKYPDAEMSHRAAELLAGITERPPHDTINAKDIANLSGTIKLDMLDCRSDSLGAFSVHLGKIDRLTVRSTVDMNLAIDAARYGSSLDTWLATGIIVNENDPVAIAATGQVDLWPQGPGQYLAMPKGYNTAGKGGQYLAGALIGKVGENGKSFLIGGEQKISAAERGELYFQIVPSPWNNASAGSYSVTIKSER